MQHRLISNLRVGQASKPERCLSMTDSVLPRVSGLPKCQGRRSKVSIWLLLLIGCLGQGLSAVARTIYVPDNYPAIKPAIAAATNGDVVVLRPGVYTGTNNTGISFAGKRITLRSESPSNAGIVASTILDGERSRSILSLTSGEDSQTQILGLTFRRGQGAMYLSGSSPVIARCVFEFNLGEGSDDGWAEVYGAAIYCTSANPRIENCRFRGNVARPSGWGSGGGAIYCSSSSPEIINCTFWGNGSNVGGGIFSVNSAPVIWNCILWENGSFAAAQSQIYADGTSTPNVQYSVVEHGSDNWWFSATCLDIDPLLTRDGHLLPNSPCIDAGTSIDAPALDADGEVRWDDPLVPNTGGPLEAYVDIGADEFVDTDRDGLPDWWEQVHFGGATAAAADQDPDGDGLSDIEEYAWGANPHNPDSDGDGWNDGIEVSRSCDPMGVNLYVNPSTGSDLFDGRAPTYSGGLRGPKKTIQGAITGSQDDQVIVLARGTYAGSGNREIDTSSGWGMSGGPVITLQSENPSDPSVVAGTIIDPQGQGRAFTFKYALSPLTKLRGVTVRNGYADSGGAILIYGSNIKVESCIFTNNASAGFGGSFHFTGDTFASGASLHLKESKVLASRSGDGGGAFANPSWLRMERCIVRKCSSATGSGQAIYAWGGDVEIHNSLFCQNFFDSAGSTIWYRDCNFTMVNCTVAYNSTNNQGCGLDYNTGPAGKVLNSILWSNGWREVSGSATVYNSCLQGGWSGAGGGNINSDPRFADPVRGNFHLAYNSPCIDTAADVEVGADLEGTPRPLDGTGDGMAAFDIGAYEFLLATADSNHDGIPDAWCRDHGFNPIDPDVANGDPDNDRLTNRQEWTADTDPNDPNSFFRIDEITRQAPVTVYFRGSADRTYTLCCATNAGHAVWADVPGQINIRGTGSRQGLSDTTPGPQKIYRLRVSVP
jgi:hypothetical protein